MTNKIGRPKNKVKTAQVCLRFPWWAAAWMRRKGSKEVLIAFIRKQLKKEAGG